MVDIHFLRYIVPALESPQVQPGKADDSEAEFSRKDNKNPCGNLIVSPSLEIIILYVASLGLEDKGGMVRVGPVPQNRWFTTRWRRSGGLGRHWGGLQQVSPDGLDQQQGASKTPS